MALLLVVFFPFSASAGPTRKDPAASVKAAVVKVYAIANPADLLSPWQGIGTEKYIGSGVIIEGERILTNAHIVAEEVTVEVKRQGMTRHFEATVEHVGDECDLALLKVAEPRFFDGVVPLVVGDLPKLQDMVEVYGFPLGGESISITSGIVSRLELGTYSHSGEALLIAQIDAALNPGNSGGPVMLAPSETANTASSKVRGATPQIVGIASQILDGAENVGYMIPAPVVRHFLDDVADGRFDGMPSLGLAWQNVENKALRASLGLKPEETGGLVTTINEGSTVDGVLREGDVLLALDGSKIGEDLTIALDDHGRVGASYGAQRKQVGESISLRVVRGKRRLNLKAELRNTPSLVPGRSYTKKPSYLIFGGLIFQPLSLDYLEFLYDWNYDLPYHLPYHAYHHPFRTEDRSEIVVLTKVLAAPLNRGYRDWENMIVVEVEGRTPRDMKELAHLIDSAKGPWLEISTDRGHRLVLDLKQAKAESPAILERYGIPRARSADLLKVRNPQSKPQDKPQAQPQAKLGAKPDAKPQTEPQAKPNAKPRAKPDAKPQTEPDAAVLPGSAQR